MSWREDMLQLWANFNMFTYIPVALPRVEVVGSCSCKGWRGSRWRSSGSRSERQKEHKSHNSHTQVKPANCTRYSLEKIIYAHSRKHISQTLQTAQRHKVAMETSWLQTDTTTGVANRPVGPGNMIRGTHGQRTQTLSPQQTGLISKEGHFLYTIACIYS